MGFLANEDYDGLPSDDGEAFAKLEAISRSCLQATERDQNDSIPVDELLRYMNEISALAHQFDIPDISYDDEPSNYWTEFAKFTRAVDYRLAQIRVQRARRDQRASVALTGNAREKIQHYIERLKDEIHRADIAEKRKSALLEKIAELEIELSKPRVSLIIVMGVIALASSIVHDNTETMLEAPKIIQIIGALFGSAKSEEEDAAGHLPKPAVFKEIPDLRKDRKPFPTKAGFADDLDDDIPF